MTSTRWRGWAVCVGIGLAGAGCGDQGPEVEPIPMYGDIETFTDHREVAVRFVSDGDTLVGTLYLPATGNAFAAVGVSQGSSWTARASWSDVGPFVNGLGVAVLSWDKRGFGQSQGTPITETGGANFAIQADDLVAASVALAGAPLIDSGRVGALGTSQGGWVVPLAANLDPATISFAIIMVGGAYSSGQDALYDDLTGLESCERTATPLADIVQQVYAAGPSGFDPLTSIVALAQPTIWIYGGLDFSHSAELSEIYLGEADPLDEKPWTIVTLPNANHDLVEGGTICQTDGPLADVVTPLSAWKADVIDG